MKFKIGDRVCHRFDRVHGTIVNVNDNSFKYKYSVLWDTATWHANGDDSLILIREPNDIMKDIL